VELISEERWFAVVMTTWYQLNLLKTPFSQPRILTCEVSKDATEGWYSKRWKVPRRSSPPKARQLKKIALFLSNPCTKPSGKKPLGFSIFSFLHFFIYPVFFLCPPRSKEHPLFYGNILVWSGSTYFFGFIVTAYIFNRKCGVNPALINDPFQLSWLYTTMYESLWGYYRRGD